ncbi:hypothetical protein N510_002013 [Firmicutes bacterium ASF500]|nr:hypothetical protein N510_002013 [Firmicutes bacterium ASF500]
MNRSVRGGTLLIRTAGDQSEVEISGNSADIMFNWTALTYQVSEALNIPPIALAAMLPQMVSDYQRTALKYEIKMGGRMRG